MTGEKCECGTFNLEGTEAYVGVYPVRIGSMTECYTDEAGRRRHSYEFTRTDGGAQAAKTADSFWFTICPIQPLGTVARSAAYEARNA